MIPATTVYIGATPALRRFDLPLLRHLAQDRDVASWYYSQNADEPACLDTAVNLLVMAMAGQPRHLIGHGLGGVIALSLAQRCPQLVRSLVLLGVGTQPALTWHAHFYVQRHLLPISREQAMARLLQTLFGPQRLPLCTVKALLDDLDQSPQPHSLVQLRGLPLADVSQPLLACGGDRDRIIGLEALEAWETQGQLWLCPGGYHFFHYTAAEAVAAQISHFWTRSIPARWLAA